MEKSSSLAKAMRRFFFLGLLSALAAAGCNTEPPTKWNGSQSDGSVVSGPGVGAPTENQDTVPPIGMPIPSGLANGGRDIGRRSMQKTPGE